MLAHDEERRAGREMAGEDLSHQRELWLWWLE